MSENNPTSEVTSRMADPNRSQLNHNGEYNSAVQLARIAERLDSLVESVRELTRKVGEQNGRVGKLEAERAAMQMRNVDAARVEVSVEGKLEDILKKCECKMGTMNDRVSGLEAFRNQTEGAGMPTKLDDMEVRVKALEGFSKESQGMLKATLGVVEKAAMILTLFLAAWRMAGDRELAAHIHEPTPAAQHQAVK